MMGYEGSNICLRSFLSFGTGYRWEVSFTPWPVFVVFSFCKLATQ
jgi:hypothetical protein